MTAAAAERWEIAVRIRGQWVVRRDVHRRFEEARLAASSIGNWAAPRIFEGATRQLWASDPPGGGRNRHWDPVAFLEQPPAAWPDRPRTPLRNTPTPRAGGNTHYWWQDL